MPKLTRQSLIQGSNLTPVTTTNGSASAPSSVKSVSATTPQNGANYIGGDAATTQLNFSPSPNVLSEVYQPSYHFSFYLDTDIPGAQGQNNTVVIAESGVTGMNIQDVQIESWVGPNLRTRNANATSITIKLYEPLGATLPDLLYQAAVKLKINNYLKAPWYLSLKFMGYDEVGGTPIPVGGSYKWALILNNIESHVSEIGSVHTIEAIPLSEDALNNKYAMLPVAARGYGSTVGDIVNGVVKTMNADADARYGSTTPRFVEYAIEDRKYPYDTKVGVSNPFAHKVTLTSPQTGGQGSSFDYNSQTGQFSPGTDIPSMMDMLFANSETAVKQARLSRALPPDTGPDDEQNIAAVSSIMHRIDTKVEYLDYHPVLGDYCKKITYIVKPYDTMRILSSMGRAQNFDKEKDLNLKKAQFAQQRSYIHKEYQYIFTGKNTEVEKFDIQTNFNWTVNFPMLQGFVNSVSTAQVDPTKDTQNHALTTQQNQNSLVSQRDAAQSDLLNAAAQGKKDAADPTISDQQKNQEVKDLQSKADNFNTLNQQVQAGQKVITGVNQTALNQSKANASSNRAALLGKPYYDLESDVTANAAGQGSLGTGGALNGGPSYLPVSIGQTAEEQNAHSTVGTPTHNDNVKSLYGALLNQMYGDFTANLQDMDLEIKGDPYWLGPGNDGTEYTKDSDDKVPNFFNGEHIFVFRFKLPMGIGDTGQVVLPSDSAGKDKTSSDIFTGFYAVTAVTNKFTEGKFTQVLEASRIPGWSIDNILNGNQGTVGEDVNFVDSPVNPASSGGSATNKPAGASSSVPNPGGKSRGAQNNNPGNLKATKFVQGLPGYTGTDDKGFAQFSTYQDGVNAQTNLLATKYLSQPTTVTAVVDKYLGYPSSGENSTASRNNYIAHVTSVLGKSTVNASDASALSQAMRQFETGDKNA